ncbi:receptor-like serine/threonine-protein kinase At4g25390 [Momordica charantia]|uniref:Receptor-like serine/threonine-protein kinase At4g25390 n=1 Tax=Momordica charantia TaxID=3673 RepID=A0A6J1CJ98_MOMCH|nr:receptor-like serine/threonine-protein kinase At4g25390 [Momordica charantia]
MPSRSISQSPSPSPSTVQAHAHHHAFSSHLLPPIVAASTAAFSLFLFLVILYRKFTRKRTAPADSKPPHRFSYSLLRRATESFSPSRRLGQGGFGSVYYGTLPHTHKEIAVKLMDSGSLQGEREFQNELFFASKIDSSFVVSVLGFCSDQKRRRMLLVYELLHNGNLQDALLHRKCPELMEWKKRFSVAVDIAKGLEHLHGLDPPVIHGDIKPSNVLLDHCFSAKIGDFGLARLKLEYSQFEVEVKVNAGVEEEKKERKEEHESNRGCVVEDCGSLAEEAESVTTGFEEFNVGVDQSPESFLRIPVSETSPETVEVATTSPETALAAAAMASPSEGAFDGASVENGKEPNSVEKKSSTGFKNSLSGKDWWWKQENGVGTSGNVKEYVMEWIGSEIKRERPKSEWIAASSSGKTVKKSEKKKNKKRLEWWMSMEDEKSSKNLKKEKRRPVREWWKEEYCEELAKKRKKKKPQKGAGSCDEKEADCWPVDDEMYREKKKRNRSRSHGSRGSIDWWLDGLSGELWRARGNSHDSTGGDITKSGGISSTPSMRGTMCYIAPEYGGGGDLSEKSDVYSYGVLLLVLIAGRRPLQVTNSPLSEFQRANLLSWARHLARAGKLIDLVDQSTQSVDREQALLCIKVALLCLQKLPARRPSMKEVVGMLTGGLDPPQLPTELSPSPPSRFPVKLHRKAR